MALFSFSFNGFFLFCFFFLRIFSSILFLFYFILFSVFGSLTILVPGPGLLFFLPFCMWWVGCLKAILSADFPSPMSSLNRHHDIASPWVGFRAFARSPNGNIIRILILDAPKRYHAYSGNLDVYTNYRTVIVLRGD